MTYPNESFEKDVRTMYEKFCSLHPEGDILRETDIITRFAKSLQQIFSNYDFKVLKLVSRTFTVIRIREINDAIKKQRLLANRKNKDGNTPFTYRGRNQIARLSSN